MKRLLILSALSLVFAHGPIAAQYVGYRPANIWGGYDEREVEPGVWAVSARLNALSGGGWMARAMANYRAAELMKERGFAYMRVLDQSGFSLDLMVGSAPAPGRGPGYARIVVRGASGADDVEGCRERRPADCRTVSVDQLMEVWRPSLDFG